MFSEVTVKLWNRKWPTSGFFFHSQSTYFRASRLKNVIDRYEDILEFLIPLSHLSRTAVVSSHSLTSVQHFICIQHQKAANTELKPVWACNLIWSNFSAVQSTEKKKNPVSRNRKPVEISSSVLQQWVRHSCYLFFAKQHFVNLS